MIESVTFHVLRDRTSFLEAGVEIDSVESGTAFIGVERDFVLTLGQRIAERQGSNLRGVVTPKVDTAVVARRQIAGRGRHGFAGIAGWGLCLVERGQEIAPLVFEQDFIRVVRR